jgi:hypothetical protein
MGRSFTLLLGCLLTGVSLARAQPPKPIPERAPPPKEVTTLRSIITSRLQAVPGLGVAEGVQLDEATFAEGVITLRGTVSSAEQRDRVLKEVEALRRTIEQTLDFKVRSVQSQFEVKPSSRLRPEPAPGEAEAPFLEEEFCPECASPMGEPRWMDYYDNGLNAFSDPNSIEKKKHWWHKGIRCKHKDKDGH